MIPEQMIPVCFVVSLLSCSNATNNPKLPKPTTNNPKPTKNGKKYLFENQTLTKNLHQTHPKYLTFVIFYK